MTFTLYTKPFFKTLVLLALIMLSFVTLAQKEKKKSRWQSLLDSGKDTTAEDYYGSNTLRYEDYIYKKNIRTVLFHNESFELTQPLLSLGTEEKFELSFDDLDADLKNYSYTIIHCNANWEPSDLVSAEYIDGFIDNNINNHQYSYNTIQKYTHYRTTFPNSTLRITKSGNYIVKVYVEGDPDNIVLTRRFMIYQSRVAITSRVLQASIIEERNYKQELDFTINYTGYQINNPYNDLTIVMTQNNRWD